ncbi:hypothetical protein TGP89_239083 [Toxoplasma gondii p89]|uniref:Uncharacterized protein n=2 Tax=Toxoplasma gondii TaxID=5811 RepID=A0A2T6INX5_TOXGO|nr:hypothetical protein TGP89_239083 [Toxoplasma gondii p89]PUA87042.1 hypothetical protein TGBR9_239083 [Toxoplasma gondii TgCATBr9]
MARAWTLCIEVISLFLSRFADRRLRLKLIDSMQTSIPRNCESSTARNRKRLLKQTLLNRQAEATDTRAPGSAFCYKYLCIYIFLTYILSPDACLSAHAGSVFAVRVRFAWSHFCFYRCGPEHPTCPGKALK